MSNSDSFLEEVTEEVRRDRMIQFLRRNALWIGLALVVIIGGAVFFEWRKSAAEAAAQARGNALWAALEMEDATARAEALAAVEMTGGEGLAFLNMQRAAALLAAEDRAGSVALLEQIAASPDSTAALRDVARLKLVSLAGDTMPEQERL
ncbi:MAG: hypothetical protein AAGF22_13470, partial [Pseudomonadota bacterium]